MNKKLKLGVVGLGRVAKSHLPAIRELAGQVELRAIVTRDEEKGRREAANWERAEVFTSFEEALRSPDVDAFVLLLPHDLHASYAIQAMNAGKHVLIEKPMAMNQAEALAMLEAAERNGVTLMVGQSRRFFRPVVESVERIRAGAIGRLMNINALLLAHMDKPAVDWWKDVTHIGGFIIPLWGSHILDYILWAYGEPPETVYAQGYSNNPHWNGEDEVAISLRFSGGRMANVLMSFNAGCRPTDEEGLTGKRIWSTQDSIYERYLIGSNGMMQLKDEYELFVNREKVELEERFGSNFAWQMHEFADAVLSGRPPLASGSEVFAVMKVIDACFESMRTNQVVRLV